MLQHDAPPIVFVLVRAIIIHANSGTNFLVVFANQIGNGFVLGLGTLCKSLLGRSALASLLELNARANVLQADQTSSPLRRFFLVLIVKTTVECKRSRRRSVRDLQCRWHRRRCRNLCWSRLGSRWSRWSRGSCCCFVSRRGGGCVCHCSSDGGDGGSGCCVLLVERYRFDWALPSLGNLFLHGRSKSQQFLLQKLNPCCSRNGFTVVLLNSTRKEKTKRKTRTQKAR